MKLNILYISMLKGNRSIGPTYSVPAQAKAQMEYDNVYWLNLTGAQLPEWNEGGLVCHDIKSVPNLKLANLPHPFDHPDLVVFEEFYWYKPKEIFADIVKRKIPYVIVPRSSMTKEAQNHKRLKKIIGNTLWFSRFAKRAVGIQFLTQEELDNSAPFGRKNGFVIPNGIQIPEEQVCFSTEKLQFTYVGRIRTYQKGLERMIEAVSKCAENIRTANAHFDLYGSDLHGAREAFDQMIDEKSISDIIEIHDAAYGEEKKKVLLNTDVFIMTSLFEGMPMGMIEALAYGIPCIATEGTNMARVIEEAHAGWNAGNSVDEIAAAINAVFDDRENLHQYGDRSRELAKKYSWGAIAKASHDVYTSRI